MYNSCQGCWEFGPILKYKVDPFLETQKYMLWNCFPDILSDWNTTNVLKRGETLVSVHIGYTIDRSGVTRLIAELWLRWDFLNVFLARTQDGPDRLLCTEHKVSHWNHSDAPFYRVRPGCCPCPPSGAQRCRGPRLCQWTHWPAHRRHAGQSGSQTVNSDDCAVMLFITRVADISLPSSSQSSHLCTLPHRHRPDIKLRWLTLDSGHWIRN